MNEVIQSRKSNMACICIYMNMSCYLNNKATFYRTIYRRYLIWDQDRYLDKQNIYISMDKLEGLEWEDQERMGSKEEDVRWNTVVTKIKPH